MTTNTTVLGVFICTRIPIRHYTRYLDVHTRDDNSATTGPYGLPVTGGLMTDNLNFGISSENEENIVDLADLKRSR